MVTTLLVGREMMEPAPAMGALDRDLSLRLPGVSRRIEDLPTREGQMVKGEKRYGVDAVWTTLFPRSAWEHTSRDALRRPSSERIQTPRVARADAERPARAFPRRPW